MSEHLRPVLRAAAIAAGRLAACAAAVMIARRLPWHVDPILQAAVVGAMAADYVTMVVAFAIHVPRGWLREGPGVYASLVGPAMVVAMGAPGLADDGLALAIGFFAFVGTAGVKGTVWYYREVLAYEA
jgi:hypothetical protein